MCGNTELIKILDLGEQFLSGIFPKDQTNVYQKVPLVLVKCSGNDYRCGLVQLAHTIHLPTMYGEFYGYRSGLNLSMVNHLRTKFREITSILTLQENDIVIDVAGNDGTFLSNFSSNLRLCSIDPTSEKFSKYIRKDIQYVADFFSADVFYHKFPDEKAKLVTSFSMFYDLEDPCLFAKEVASILDPQTGIWVLEQSYLPEMLKTNSFDTICHEHLSYYGMYQLKRILDSAKLKIVDIQLNGINGGSVSLVVAHEKSNYMECTDKLSAILQAEIDAGINTIEIWDSFEEAIATSRESFMKILNLCREKELKICGIGASTKGNVTLQTWKLGANEIEVIGDVNPDKYGHQTPGSWIPIVSEDEVLNMNYDIYLILPWHFKDFFMSNDKFAGKTLLFPLPIPELVTT
jgi:hypothetical protein